MGTRFVFYRKQLQIEAICIDEKSREKGIGTELLKYAKKLEKKIIVQKEILQTIILKKNILETIQG